MKKARYVVQVALINLVVFYVPFELYIRYFGIQQLASGQSITQILKKIDRENISIDAFVKRRYSTPNERNLVYDDQIGWDREVREPRSCLTAVCGKRYRILVVGDSVTQGFGIQDGEEWPEIFAGAAPSRIEVINAGVDGYSMYQMYLKAERELEETLLVSPVDLIIFAYIDHDLLRPAAPYLWGQTQPSFRLGGDSVTVVPPEQMTDLIRSFASAWSYFYTSAWATTRFYEKRRYYFPVLYKDYFNRVPTIILKLIRGLARAHNVPVVLLRLPQNVQFRGRELLQDGMNNAWKRVGVPEALMSRPDIEPCVRDSLKQEGIDLDQALNRFHPDARVQAHFGRCAFEKIIQPLLAARN